MSDYHLSLSIGRTLWTDLVGAALPLQVADGAFDLGKVVYNGVKQLQVRQKVSALLEDHAQGSVKKAKDKLSDIWKSRKDDVFKVLGELLHVEGEWQVEVDKKGTDFHYGDQKLGVDAHVKAMINGKVQLLKSNVELPFHIEKRIGASCHIGNIRFDQEENAVVGSVQDPMVNLGENAIFQLINEGIGTLLRQQTDKFDSVPIIKKAQLEEMVAPAGGPLKLNMGIEDVRIEVTEEELSLKIKFGFQNIQLPGS